MPPWVYAGEVLLSGARSADEAFELLDRAGYLSPSGRNSRSSVVAAVDQAARAFSARPQAVQSGPAEPMPLGSDPPPEARDILNALTGAGYVDGDGVAALINAERDQPGYVAHVIASLRDTDVACGRCRQPMPVSARYCGGCGAPLGRLATVD